MSALPIPVKKERVNVLIGKNGKTKKMLEEAFNVELEVDSENALVYVRQKDTPLTPLSLMKVENAVKAISIGFAPEDAVKLADDMIMLEVIDLRAVARHKRDLQRIKGRIIGEEGKAKRMIEDLTGTKIAVGEKEIGIIGDFEGVSVAREAIEMLIQGRTHRTVYNFLRSKARDIKRRRMELWEKLRF